MKGCANNAICPECRGYTKQIIVRRGRRQCLGCSTAFNVRDVQRITNGKIIYPKFKGFDSKERQ